MIRTCDTYEMDHVKVGEFLQHYGGEWIWCKRTLEFWTRWRKEVLLTLQNRQKWNDKRRNCEILEILH